MQPGAPKLCLAMVATFAGAGDERTFDYLTVTAAPPGNASKSTRGPVGVTTAVRGGRGSHDRGGQVDGGAV